MDNKLRNSTFNNDIQGFRSSTEITDIVESINYIGVIAIADKTDEARKATKFSQGLAFDGVPIALPNGGAELNTGFTFYSQNFTENPFKGKKNSNPAWTLDDLAGLEYIIEQNTDTKEVRVTQFFAVINYETAPPSIEITNSPVNVKWGHTATIEGVAGGFGTIGTISIDWGDGTVENFDATAEWQATHQYAENTVSPTETNTVTATLTVNADTPSDTADIDVLAHDTSLDAPTIPVNVKWGHTFQVTSNTLTDLDAVGGPAPVEGKTIAYSGTAVASANDGTSTVGTPVDIVSVGAGNTGDQSVIADFGGDPAYNSSTSPSSTITIIAHDTSLDNPTISGSPLKWGDTFTVDSNILTDLDAVGGPAPVEGKTITYSGLAVASPTNGTSTVSGLEIIQTSSPVTLLKHDTQIVDLKAITSGSTGKPISISGILIDNDNQDTGISFKEIIISGNGSNDFPNPMTGGIVLQDADIQDADSELEVRECPICVIENTTPNNRVMLTNGSQVLLDQPVTYVTLNTEQSQGKEIKLTVNDSQNQTISTDLDAAGTYMILGPNVSNITINEITGGDGESSIGLIRILGTSEEANITVLNATLSTIDAGFYQEIPVGGGSFGTGGLTQNSTASDLQVNAEFLEDNLYLGTSDTTKYSLAANLEDNSDLGFGALVNVVADSGIGISGALCGLDTDKDALCEGWEDNNKGYGANGKILRLVLPDIDSTTKNLFVEIDYMEGHEPDAVALDQIKTVFAENDIKVTFFVDEEIPHVDPINVWIDNDSDPTNDFNSIKSKYYQPANERSSATGQSYVNNPLQSPSANTRTLEIIGITVDTPPASSRISGGAAAIDNTQGTITIKTKITTDNVVIPSIVSVTTPTPGSGLSVGTTSGSVLPIPGKEHIISIKVPFTTNSAITGVSLGQIDVKLSFNANPGDVIPIAEQTSPAVSTTLREAYAQMVRYVIFAHDMGGSSGTAEFLGNDAVITLGEGFGEVDDLHSGTEGTTEEQAGTLMHEIGHWLGLKHGGPETIGGLDTPDSDVNCKPNYVSVMSYTRQTPVYLDSFWFLDFSHGNQKDLIEDSLDESKGFQSTDPEDKPRLVSAASSGPPFAKAPSTYELHQSLSVNWLRDGINPTPGLVSVDINNLGIPGCNTPGISTTPHVDHDDWANLKFNFRDTVSGSFDASTAIYPTTISDISSSFIQFAELQSISLADPIAVPPPNPDGSTTANQGSTLPIKIPIFFENSTVPIDFATLHAEYLYLDNNGSVVVENVIDGTGNRIFEYDPVQEFYKLEWIVPSDSSGEHWVTVFVAEPNADIDNPIIDTALIPEICPDTLDPNNECPTFKIGVIAKTNQGGPDCEQKPDHRSCQ
jgi:hypothetical protein